MKKNIITAVILGASLLSFNAFAQAPGKPDQDTFQPAQCDKDKPCDKDVCPPGGRLKNFDPFIGTTITPEQRAKIDELNANRKAKDEAARKEAAAKQMRNDSLRRASQLDYLREVKEIIGPDQYVIFLENMVVGQPGGKGAAVKGDMPRGGKDFKKGDSPRPGKDMKKGDGKKDGPRHDGKKQKDSSTDKK